MIRAAILCRVSTEGQRENTSLAEQRRILTDLCERQGWAYEVFEEVESGAAGIANRPTLAAILGRIAAGEFSRLVVLVQDRLSRAGVGELEEISRILARVGARLVTQSGELDPGNPDHVLIGDINAVIGKRERAAIRERTVRGREARAKAGGFVGHPVPFGWRRVWAEDGTTRFEIQPDQAEVVRRLFDRYATNTVGLALLETDFGLPDTTIQMMLGNPRYVGMERFRRRGGTANPHGDRPEILVPSQVWPAIVSRDTWDRVQMTLQQRSRAGRPIGAAKWPLSGILRCEGCGGGLSLHSTHNPGGVYRYYQCRNRACTAQQRFPILDAHRALLAALPAILDHFAAVTAAAPDDATPDRLRDLDAALAAIDREELDLWRQKQGGLDEGLWRRLSDDLLDRRRTVEASRRALQSRSPRLDSESLPVGEAVRELVADETLPTDRERLREIVVGLFSEIRMRPGPKVSQARLLGGIDWSL